MGKTVCSPKVLLRNDSKKMVSSGPGIWLNISLILIVILLSRGDPLHFTDVATVSKC